MNLKEIVTNFNISFWSIFLGMLCTFVGQGMIDRATARKEVRSALEMVRTELTANVEDLGIMNDYIKQERKSAEYFLRHANSLSKCPADSIEFHGSVIFSDASIILNHNAQDLLTMTGVFQNLGDSPLSMKIIRAYDTCESLADLMNQHIESRNSRFNRALNDKLVAQFASKGRIDIPTYLKTPYGLYTLRWLVEQHPEESFTDISDIESAIEAIEDYLVPARIKKKQQRKQH